MITSPSRFQALTMNVRQNVMGRTPKPGDPEIWKPIRGYNKRYSISSYGRVRLVPYRVRRSDGKMYRYSKTKELKPYKRPEDRPGLYVGLRTPYKHYRSHKNIAYLVATHFLYRPANTVYRVDWLDGDPENNHVWNLRWRAKEG